MTARGINVLIGNCEITHAVTFQMLIRKRFKDTAGVTFTVCDRLDDLLDQASNNGSTCACWC
ncbi:MAG: hypothetical protein ABI651_04835 [Verrucomicrobiota bacterium]